LGVMFPNSIAERWVLLGYLILMSKQALGRVILVRLIELFKFHLGSPGQIAQKRRAN
jgi:hypothetical protein